LKGKEKISTEELFREKVGVQKIRVIMKIFLEALELETEN